MVGSVCVGVDDDEIVCVGYVNVLVVSGKYGYLVYVCGMMVCVFRMSEVVCEVEGWRAREASASERRFDGDCVDVCV